MQKNISITIYPESTEGKLKMPWKNCISVGRAYDLIRHDLFNHLKFIQDTIGYRYCRFHAIFDDDMGVVTRDANGKLFFSWHQVDKVYDSLLQMGLKPFVELNPMPVALASGDQTMFHFKMNVTPPTKYDEWGLLVREFTKHLVGRYGLDELRQWYFEVWNEPNLSAFFSGSKDDYFELYRVCSESIKSVDPQLRVGGPATSKGSWISDFIEFCYNNNVPLDFVSTHLYPQDEFVQYKNKDESPHEPGKFFQDIVRSVSREVKSSPMPNLPIHWTEWNTQSATDSESVTWLENIFVDNLYAAACIIENCYQLDNECETFCYWIASDIFFESGLKHTPFSNTYGMLTIHGIPKASYNAFYLLNKMKGMILKIESSSDLPRGCNALATINGETLHVLLWNHHAINSPESDATWEGSVIFPHSGALNIVSYRVGHDGGSAWEIWKEMGSMANMTKSQEEYLHAKAKPKLEFYKVESLLKSPPKIKFSLKSNEVLYMEITRTEESIIREGSDKPEMERWNTGMGKKSEI
jgi:xylan 1,4-beta-xylosidase